MVAQSPKQSLTSVRKKTFLNETTSFGHDLMTRSGLTRPEVSLMVSFGFFCYLLQILPELYNPSCLLEKFHTVCNRIKIIYVNSSHLAQDFLLLGGSFTTFLRKVRNRLPDDTTSYGRTPELSRTTPWGPKLLHMFRSHIRWEEKVYSPLLPDGPQFRC